jgi:hypothetical protein
MRNFGPDTKFRYRSRRGSLSSRGSRIFGSWGRVFYGAGVESKFLNTAGQPVKKPLPENLISKHREHFLPRQPLGFRYKSVEPFKPKIAINSGSPPDLAGKNIQRTADSLTHSDIFQTALIF